MRLLVVFLVALGAVPCGAQLLSPGKLARGHADLEGLSNCTRCHAAGDQVSAERCLDCHDKLAARLRQGQGYHARVTGACVECHSDHRGVDYDMVRWDTLRFDHDSTGYDLEGRHAEIRCGACHQDPTTYMVQSTECLSCHADEHRNQLAADCLQCHEMAAWKPAQFDHGRARFALLGKHLDVACDGCHAAALDDSGVTFTRYRPIAFVTCGDCHADHHRGQFDEDCAACHSVAGWKPAPVDHERTRFPLLGKHNEVSCVACHGPAPGAGDEAVARFRGLAFEACGDCHADYHQGQFVEDCASCHSVSGWKPVPVDHERTRFPLSGKHTEVSCVACHGPTPEAGEEAIARFRGLAFAACGDCHADYHQGQFIEDCAACHSVSGWKLAEFDHERTRFPLRGKHVTVACDGCHLQEQSEAGALFTRLRGVAFGECRDCHADRHAGQFADDCAACHLVAGWSPSTFDHDRARFPLDGAHVDVACPACHGTLTDTDGRATVRYRPVPTDCAICHG